MSKKKSYWDMMMSEDFSSGGKLTPEERKRREREEERRKLEDEKEKLKDEENEMREKEIKNKWKAMQQEEERVRKMKLEKERKLIEAKRKALEHEKQMREKEQAEIEKIKMQIEEKDRKFEELQKELENKKNSEGNKRKQMNERLKRLREQRKKKEEEKLAVKRKLEQYRKNMKEKERSRRENVRIRKEKEEQLLKEMEEKKKRELQLIEREHRQKRDKEAKERKRLELEREREEEERKREEVEERRRKQEEREKEFELERVRRREEERKIEELRAEREKKRREKREFERREREKKRVIKEENRRKMEKEIEKMRPNVRKIYEMLLDQDDEEYFEAFQKDGITYEDLVSMTDREMSHYIPDEEKRTRFRKRIEREEKKRKKFEEKLETLQPVEKKLFKLLRDQGLEEYYDVFEKEGLTYDDVKDMSHEELKRYIPDDSDCSRFKKKIEQEKRNDRRLEGELRRMKPEMKEVYDLLKEQGDEEYFENFQKDGITLKDITEMTDGELENYIPDKNARQKFKERVELEEKLKTIDPSEKRVYDILKTAGGEKFYNNFYRDGITYDELKNMDEKELSKYVTDTEIRGQLKKQLDREIEMEKKEMNQKEMEEKRREEERKRLDEERHKKNKPQPKTAPKFNDLDKPVEEMDDFEKMKYEFFKRKAEMEGWSKDFDDKQEVRETERIKDIQEEKLEKGITINIKEVDDEDEEAEEFKLFNLSVTGLHQVIMKWSTYSREEFDNFFKAAYLEKDDGELLELKHDKDIKLLDNLSYIAVKFK